MINFPTMTTRMEDNFKDETVLHLTEKAVEYIQPDNGETALQDAEEAFNNGDFAKGNSLVLLIAMYGMMAGDQELVNRAKKISRFVSSDN